MASHQAIREVVEAFNAGRLQLELEFDFPTEAEELRNETYETVGQRVVSDGPPEITLTTHARDGFGGKPKVILIVHRLDKTERMTF